jgi:hypothetical protein
MLPIVTIVMAGSSSLFNVLSIQEIVAQRFAQQATNGLSTYWDVYIS